MSTEASGMREGRMRELRERIAALEWTRQEGGVELFTQRAREAGCVVVDCSAGEADSWLREHLRGKERIAASADALLTALGIDRVLAESGANVSAATEGGTEEVRGLSGADLGITVALAGIAASGSLLCAVSPDEHRSVSLLPDEHVVFLDVARIVPSLHQTATLLRRLAVDDARSAVTLIGGPSKTADIEKVLVTGVHGPGTLTIVLVRSSV